MVYDNILSFTRSPYNPKLMTICLFFKFSYFLNMLKRITMLTQNATDYGSVAKFHSYLGFSYKLEFRRKFRSKIATTSHSVADSVGK